MMGNVTESDMMVFGSYTTIECAYKLLEESAELYGAWETVDKDECDSNRKAPCGECGFQVLCAEYLHLAEELYDVLQVCVNIAAKIGNRASFEGKPRRRNIDKVFMHGMLGSCAEVFHRINHGYEQDMVEVLLEYIVSDVFTIAYAYGVDMAWAISVGTDKNIRRGRH